MAGIGEYRRFGKTDLKVSVLGFGASSLGGAFKDCEEEAGIRAVREAIDLGINFIDTSPFYGLTKSETVLGKALKGIPRDKYVLASKAGRYGYKIKDFDFSEKRVLASIEESLQRLGIDAIDVIQVHDMEFGDATQIVNETIPALRKAQRQGKVRYVGVTALPLPLLKRVSAEAEVDTIQSYCHYCLNDTSLDDYIADFQAKDLGVISSAPLSMGLLTIQGPPHWHPAPVEVREACAKAARHCREKGADLSKLALQFAVANPNIHTCLVSTTKAERVRQNVQTISEPMDEGLLSEVLGILKPIHNATWPQGRPENNDPEVVASYRAP
jgi:L-galactose dehydrogenase